MKKVLSISSILLACALHITAQQSQIAPTQKSNFHLYSDSTNNLYISTTDGLNIYNGRTIKLFNASNSGIHDNNIQSGFFIDRDDNIWFASYMAINMLIPNSGKFSYHQFNHPTKGVQNADYSILACSDKQLLAKAGKSLFLYNIDKDSTSLVLDCNLSSASPYSKAIHKDNRYYIFASTALKSYIIELDTSNETLDTSFVINCVNSKPQIYKNEQFIFSNDEGEVYKINAKSSKPEKLMDHGEKIFNIHIHNDSILSILFDKRIEQYNLPSLQKLHSIPLNIEGTKTSIYMDQNQTIWLSVDGKGIYAFNTNKSKFKHLSNIHSDKTANARSFTQLNNGHIYYSSRDNGIGIMDSDYNFIKQYNTTTSSLKSNFILKIDNDSNDHIYAISGYKLLSLSDDNFSEIPLDRNSYFYDMLINKNDELLLVGSDSNEVYKVIQSNNTYTTIPVLDRFPDNYIVSLFELQDSSLVIGVNAQSFAIYRPCDNIYCYDTSYDISSDIKSIWEMPESDEIYLSSSSGLYLFSDGFQGKYEKISDREGLLNQCIYYVLGNKNELWLSSNTGLLRYNTLTADVHQFTEADGIQGQEYNTTAGMIDRNGNFLFGGTNGINIFHPDSVHYLDYNAPIHISNFLVNDEEYDVLGNPNFIEKIKLDHRNNTLGFWFHGIDHSDPSNVKLRYKLQNYDEDWVNIKENNGRIRYANLPAGRYILKLHATNSDGIWSSKIKTIFITITPPFWQTLWFRFLAILSIALISWTIVRSYYKRKLREKDLQLREQRLFIDKQKALEAERNRIAAEMHDDLGGGLTSIKFLSHKVLKQKDGDPRETLNKIVDQSHRLIDNMSEIIWAMNAGNDTLNNLLFYLRDYTIKFLDNFNLSHDLNFVKPAQDLAVSGEKRRNIFLIYKESLHNIIKHAEAGSISISAELIHDILHISVSDDGKGFKQEETRSGNGLLNIQKRIKQLNGDYTIESSSDGTTIIYKIPLPYPN